MRLLLIRWTRSSSRANQQRGDQKLLRSRTRLIRRPELAAQVSRALHTLATCVVRVKPGSTRFSNRRAGCAGKGVGDDGRARKVLERVLEEATGFLEDLPDRRVAARTDVDGVANALRRPLPEEGAEPLEVVEELIAGAEPGVVAMPSGRFFGWVIGGVLPATLAADWLTSTWDQNAGLLASSPAAAGAEWVASEWFSTCWACLAPLPLVSSLAR